MFNALFSRGPVAGVTVADLFAGSGALGIEALSRGAAAAWFVESDRRAAAVIADNLATLGFADRATVLCQPVAAAVAELPTGLDIVLADPPYAFDGWEALLDRIAPHLAANGVVVAESDRPVPLPPGWENMRERTYGGTVISFAVPPADLPVGPPGRPPVPDDPTDATGADA